MSTSAAPESDLILSEKDLDYIANRLADRVLEQTLRASLQMKAMQDRQTALELKLDRIIALFNSGKVIA